MANTYDMGEKVKITGTFTLNGEPADPATVRIYYKDPSGTIVTKTYGVDPEIAKESSGVYSFSISLDEAGSWYYRMDDGGNNVAAEGQFQVRISNLI